MRWCAGVLNNVGLVAGGLCHRLRTQRVPYTPVLCFWAQLYAELGVPVDRVLIRVPATWAGLQAAGALEKDGIATHAILVYSYVQGLAAAQAGVSVVQPNVGRIADWCAG